MSNLTSLMADLRSHIIVLRLYLTANTAFNIVHTDINMCQSALDEYLKEMSFNRVEIHKPILV